MESVGRETLLRLPPALSVLVLGLPGNQSCATDWTCWGLRPAVRCPSHCLDGKPCSGKVWNAADLSAERQGRSGASVLLGGHPKFYSKGENKTKQHKTQGAKGFLFSLVDCPRFWYREVEEGRVLAQETRILIRFNFPSLRQRTSVGRSGAMRSHLLAEAYYCKFLSDSNTFRQKCLPICKKQLSL